MKYLKPYNESIKDFLKPKSKDEILNDTINMYDGEKFLMACQYGIDWMVNDMIENGFDPTFKKNQGLITACRYRRDDIIKILLYNSDIRFNLTSGIIQDCLMILYNQHNKKMVKFFFNTIKEKIPQHLYSMNK